MPELTSTKLVIYLDIQLFLIGKSPFAYKIRLYWHHQT